MGWSNGAAWLSNDGGWYKNVATIGPAYVGPGDIVPGASVWFGLRGYNASYSTGSNPAVDLVDQAGANSVTINIKSNGDLDTGAISTWVAAHSVTTIKITKLYDQSGNGVHLTQATLGSMPVLTLTGVLGTRPVIDFTSGASSLASSGSITSTAQPFTVSFVAERTGNTSAFNAIFGLRTNSTLAYFMNTPNEIGIYQGTSLPFETANDNVFHAIQNFYLNTGDGEIYVDGSSATGNQTLGGPALNAAGTVTMGQQGTGVQFLTGYVCEAGLFPGFTSGNVPTMNSNQHSYWGF